MHGHWRSLGLPKFGVKVIAMTSGRLTFYGQPVEPWSLLHAIRGDNIIYVQGDLRNKGWVADAYILVSSTGYGTEKNCRMDRKDKCQTEKFQIQSVSIEPSGNVMKYLEINYCISIWVNPLQYRGLKWRNCREKGDSRLVG